MDTTKFSQSRINNRQIDELIGLCRGIIANGEACQKEAEYLEKWLIANQAAANNPVINNLAVRVSEMLEDNVLDSDESAELYQTLEKFAGGDFELGEIIKSTTLPLDDPAPHIIFDDRLFCFTGTFSYGKRAECEQAVIERGGLTNRGINKKLDYLIIGVYATDDWKHSSYGNKIEKAVEYRDSGQPLTIISETHWQQYLQY